MTPRQRFHATMAYERPDRAPWLEEGLRDEVLERWQEQGLPVGADLPAMFHYDRRERIELNLEPRPPRDKTKGLPENKRDLEELARGLDADDRGRLPADWAAKVERWRNRDHILELPLHRGLFLTMGVGNWASLEPVLYLLADHPDLAKEIMDLQGRLCARLAQRVLSEVTIDCASLSEPICDNHGPLVSPKMYREICLASYQPILDVLRQHKVETIIFTTYGNARCLLPDVMDAGFNCLWAMETETTAMDYRELRKQFGKRLRLIGGIDLDALIQGPAAIDEEMDEKVPALLKEGGYIPLADGRVRPAVPFAAYEHYRKRLEEMTA